MRALGILVTAIITLILYGHFSYLGLLIGMTPIGVWYLRAVLTSSEKRPLGITILAVFDTTAAILLAYIYCLCVTFLRYAFKILHYGVYVELMYRTLLILLGFSNLPRIGIGYRCTVGGCEPIHPIFSGQVFAVLTAVLYVGVACGLFRGKVWAWVLSITLSVISIVIPLYDLYWLRSRYQLAILSI